MQRYRLGQISLKEIEFNMKKLLLCITIIMAFACDDQNNTQGENGGMNTGATAGNGGENGGTPIGGTVLPGGEQGMTTTADQGLDTQLPDLKIWDMGNLDQDPSTLPDVYMPPPAPMACIEHPPVPEQEPLNLDARCKQGNENLKIRHIRDARCRDTYIQGPTRQPGIDVVLEEVVVTGVYGIDKFSAQDLDGGIYSGIWVFNKDRETQNQIQVGSKLRLTGQVIEFFTLTELVIESGGVEILGQAPVPAPIKVSDSAKIADGGEWVEQLESVLVEVNNAIVSNTSPDCPIDYGMLVVNQNLRIGRLMDIAYAPKRGDVLTKAVGVVYFSFDHNKLYPRTLDDLQIIDCGGPMDKCDADECSVPADALENGKLIITEIQVDPAGDDNLREFVELYNPNPTPVVIDGWRLEDCGKKGTTLSGTVEGRGYFVAARSLNRNENGGVRAQSLMGDLFLPNGPGSVLVFDQNNVLVDQVRYEPSDAMTGWPARRSGESLELVEPASDNRIGASWDVGQDSYGDGGKGSPGASFR